MRELPEWLISNTGFRKRFKKLASDSVAGQFATLQRVVETDEIPALDLSYMMTCASVLAHSENGKCQDAALRIAQFCLTDESSSPQRRDGAALILDALANQASIRLAEKRGYLAPEYEDRLPFSAQLESTKRRILHTIKLSDDEKIVANGFQLEFWDGAEENQWLSVSAPTSVGKSFILETWIHEYLLTHGNSLVVYLVPTRALISEVEAELASKLSAMGSRVNVTSLPLQRAYVAEKSNVLVFTQERFHIFLNSFPVPPTVDVLVVDEAHKVGDGHRGVFLQQVIELTSSLNPKVRVIFASPFTSNPEILLDDGPQGKVSSIKSSNVTVNQNLIWVTQKARQPKAWEAALCFDDETRVLGDFALANTPIPDSKRLPFVAIALSQGKPGNIVYVNGAADAEKTALQIFDCLQDAEVLDSELAALVELCEKTIHKRFLLNRVLRRGVAFHYGNMPLLVKSEIERLFSANKIAFLICTSTLVEGVNMSCKNIFMRGPKKGKNSLMGQDDFWNLAGRAGRWGKEFQGNVICVDANNAKLWEGGEPPRKKSGILIKRTADELIRGTGPLIEYIQSDNHFNLSASRPDLEHVFSYLAITYGRFGSLQNSPFLRRQSGDDIERLNQAVGAALATITYPPELIARNPGISPLLMERLIRRFGRDTQKPAERLLLGDPGSDDALDTYVSAFGRISDELSPKLGFTSKHAYVRALLVVRWMRGFALARLITDRINYLSKKEKSTSEPTVIRDVMKDVEEIARYQAPRLLSCYNDLLHYYLSSIGRADLQAEVKDVSIFLELGLSQQTQISLVSLGLSRTAAVMISEIIAADDLTDMGCARWLKENSWQEADLPVLVKAEIGKALEGFLRRHSQI
jgi:hypothetical protein